MIYEVPLTADPRQFGITLGGVALRLTVAWRNAGGAGWVLDIADTNGVPAVTGIPLTTGADLLAPYRHLGISGELWAQTDGAVDAVPTFGNLGTESHLYWDDGLGVMAAANTTPPFLLDKSRLDGTDALR